MLINVFDNWFNPEGVIRLTEHSSYERSTPYTEIHFTDSKRNFNIMGKKPNEVGAEINRQLNKE